MASDDSDKKAQKYERIRQKLLERKKELWNEVRVDLEKNE
jgi:hypothetical protein